MAIWKVKSQTAVTVELLGGLPQSDCEKMNGDLQADPPAKTVHGQGAPEPPPSLLQVNTQVYPRSTQSLPKFAPFWLLSTWPACWSPWLRLPSEASREVGTAWALGLGRKPGSWQPETIS